jgi:enoyl-CoA hydratase/carnithine racemase
LTFKSILYDADGGVATITFNRPERLNALSPDMRLELDQALAQADGDESVRCLILTGNGRAFCAGGDLGSGGRPSTAREALQRSSRVTAAEEAFAAVRKPVIGAINGHCFGGGLMLALKCDILLAAESALFGLPQVRQGSPAVIDLLWLVGPQWARYLNYTGDTIGAAKAKEIGLAMEVFPDDRLHDRAVKLGQRIAATPPASVQWTRRAIDGGLEMMGLRQAQTLASLARAITGALSTTAETRDGVNLRQVLRDNGLHAFLEARDGPYHPPWP